jgi:hypothetical protein
MEPAYLDSSTFGTSPAAIYLADLLNRRGNARLNRKVSRTLSNQRSYLNDLVNAHFLGAIPLSTFCALLELMSANNQAAVVTAIAAESEPFIANLVVNILEGGVKTWKRRAQEAARTRSTVARNTKPGDSVLEPMAVGVPNEKTAEDLVKRSKAYLARKGKKDTLY